jgi:hypothetical protein
MKQLVIRMMKSRVLKIAAAGFIACGGSVLPTSASAAIVQLKAVPTNWRVQYYTTVSGIRSAPVVAMFFTGVTAACAGPSQGFSIIGSNANLAADAKRLYETLLAAKLTKAAVVVEYDDVTCSIDSFGLAEG